METPLPVALEEAAAAATVSDLYVIGGFDASGQSLSTVWIFDGSTWSRGPDLPLPLDHSSAALFNGEIYLAGGHSNGGDSDRTFRLEGNRWIELGHLSHARGGHALVNDGRYLYAMGGNAGSTQVATVEFYGDSWRDSSLLPQPRNHLAGFQDGNRACVAGGRPPATARIDCLSGAEWSSMPPLPEPTSGAGADFTSYGDLIVAGGQDATETQLVPDVQLLRDGASTWTTEPMLVPRHGFELALFHGRDWACGGGTAPGLHPTNVCTSII